jgi:hypothetical protein
MTGRTWQLQIVAPAPWLTANDRINLYAYARHTRLWRSRTYVQAIAQHLPKGLARVRVDAVLRFPTVRRRDPPNFYPTVKACIDALGPPITRNGRQVAPGYQLIADDTPRYLDGPHITEGQPWTSPRGLPQPGCLELTITELSDEARPP